VAERAAGVRPLATGTPPLEQIKYLILPALSLVLVLFGYIARMARAGTVTALDSDYDADGDAEGPAAAHRRAPPRAAQRSLADHHRDRDAARYLIGGLVVVEQLFNYNGIGTLL
jgi:peptide/nickel transport system permease protein